MTVKTSPLKQCQMLILILEFPKNNQVVNVLEQKLRMDIKFLGLITLLGRVSDQLLAFLASACLARSTDAGESRYIDC